MFAVANPINRATKNHNLGLVEIAAGIEKDGKAWGSPHDLPNYEDVCVV